MITAVGSHDDWLKLPTTKYEILRTCNGGDLLYEKAHGQQFEFFHTLLCQVA